MEAFYQRDTFPLWKEKIDKYWVEKCQRNCQPFISQFFCSVSFPKMLVLTTWAYVAIILLYSGATVVNFSALVGNFNAD